MSEVRTIKGPCFDCDDALDDARPNVPPRMIAAAEDVLSSAYSTEEVVASIRADGGDPEGIGQRGVAFVKQLLDKRRLAWQEAARQKLEPDELRPNVPPRMM